uniref:DDT domain-containing protein n=1 Tax=Anisakis simplex TaxID=6269 RepID=A0A0M3JCZ6_ANISI
LQQGNRVPIENDEQAATRLIPASQQPESLLATTGKASAGAAAAAGRAQVSSTNKTRTKRSWADEFIDIFVQIPCYGSPIPAMDFLAQFVLEVPSYEALFEMNFLKTLCSVHTHLFEALDPFTEITPYR